MTWMIRTVLLPVYLIIWQKHNNKNHACHNRKMRMIRMYPSVKAFHNPSGLTDKLELVNRNTLPSLHTLSLQRTSSDRSVGTVANHLLSNLSMAEGDAQQHSNFHWTLRHGLRPVSLHHMATSAPRRIREDIRQVIQGLTPLVESSASLGPVNTQNLSAWLRQHQGLISGTLNDTPSFTAPSSSSRSVSTNDFVIDMDGERHRNVVANTSPPAENTPQASTPSSPSSNRNNTGPESNSDSNGDTADALRNNPELRTLVSLAEKYVPFLLILLLKLVFDHRIGILVIIGLFVTFVHANAVVKREVGKQGKRQFTSLLTVSANLIACIAFVYLVLAEDNLAYALIFVPPYSGPINIWEVLWIVTVTDYVLKLFAILLKVIIVAVPSKIVPFQKKGKHYLFIEASSQLYRTLAPMQHWLYFFSESYHGSSKVFGVILSAAYLVSKCKDIIRKTRMWKKSLGRLLQSVKYGVTPSIDQLKTAGEACPICQDDYRTPTMLQCKHIFCEECVSLWFDRERTCPMCRAQVADDPTWRDGSTTYLLQIF